MVQPPANHPNTGHQSPYWYSDSRKGIRDHRRSVPRGYRCFKDLNEQPLLDAEGIIHWNTARENGYLFIKTKFGRRALTEHELDLPFRYWPAKKFVRLRRTKKLGISHASRVRPLLLKEAVRICYRYDTIPCIEVKSAFQIAERAIRMAAICQGLAIFMALFKMSGIYAKGKAFTDLGEPFVILAHGEPRPDVMPPHAEIWGHFS